LNFVHRIDVSKGGSTNYTKKIA